MFKGFKFFVGKTSNKRFLLRDTYHRRKCSIGLGRFGGINVASARKLTQKHRMSLLDGNNPKVERNCPTRLTIDEFFQQHYLCSGILNLVHLMICETLLSKNCRVGILIL